MAGEVPERPATDGLGAAVADRSIDVLAAALADRYAIEGLLGRGATASVYLAHDRRHGRRIALKVLHDALGSAVGVERFQREIRVAARLQHPNILPLFDSGSDAGWLWYVTPLVETGSLRDGPERLMVQAFNSDRISGAVLTADSGLRAALARVTTATFAGDSARYPLLKAEAAWFAGDRPARLAHADSARQVFEASLASLPDDPRRLAHLGVVYSFLGRHADAIRTGRRAVEMLPVTLDAHAGPFLVSSLARSYMAGRPARQRRGAAGAAAPDTVLDLAGGAAGRPDLGPSPESSTFQGADRRRCRDSVTCGC